MRNGRKTHTRHTCDVGAESESTGCGRPGGGRDTKLITLRRTQVYFFQMKSGGRLRVQSVNNKYVKKRVSPLPGRRNPTPAIDAQGRGGLTAGRKRKEN